MVDTKQALKLLWKDKCKITVKDQEVFDPESKTTSYVDSVLVENEPCKLSFETLSTASEDAVKAKIVQKAKLFITNNNTTWFYCGSYKRGEDFYFFCQWTSRSV